MRSHERVGVLGHAAVVAWKGVGVHAEAGLAFIVALGHVALCGQQGLKLRLHALHGAQQPAGLVFGLRLHVVAQLTVGDRLSSLGGACQRLGQASGDEPRQQAADQNDGCTAKDEQELASIHGLDGFGIRLAALSFLTSDELTDFFLPGERGGPSFLTEDVLGLRVFVLGRQRDDFVVELHGDCPALVHLSTDLSPFLGAGQRVQLGAQVLVALTLVLDRVECFGVEFFARCHGIRAQRDQERRVGIQHAVADLDLRGAVENDEVQLRPRVRHGAQAGGHKQA